MRNSVGRGTRHCSPRSEGVRVVLGHRLLRAIAGCTGTWNFFNSLWYALNATMRFLVWGTMPLGGLLGGLLGQVLGLREAIGVGAVGSLLSGLWVLYSPLRALERIPDPPV